MRFIFFPLLLFILFNLSGASEVSAQSKKLDIDCKVILNQTVWNKNTVLSAKLIITNRSSEKVKIHLPPRFRLKKVGERDWSSQKLDDEFISSEKEIDHIITKRRKNGYSYRIKQFYSFELRAGEKTFVDFNLTNLAWNDAMQSILVDTSWHVRIPSGKYNFYYRWSYESSDRSGSKYVLVLESNKTAVELISEK